MPLCPSCQQPAIMRNGRDPRGRQKYACHYCRRTFAEKTTSASAAIAATALTSLPTLHRGLPGRPAWFGAIRALHEFSELCWMDGRAST